MQQLAHDYIDGEQSSFEETQGIVSNKDDHSLPCSTFRSWTLGLISVGVCAFVRQYFFYQANSYYLSATILLLLAYPCGKFLEFCLPSRHFNIRWPRKYSFTFNPGKFSQKEHALIYIMAFIGSQIYVSCDLIVSAASLINQPVSYGTGLTFVLSAEILGYGLAGICRRFLVWPSEMIWPENLPIIAFLRTVHEDESRFAPKWLHFTRRRFLLLIMICMAIYQWFPDFIMPVLTSFSWLCMINRNNVVLSQVGGSAGLAILAFKLNWRDLSSSGNGLISPIIVPRWAQANVAIGFFLVAWLVLPIVYYSNLWDFRHLPMFTCGFYDVNGNYNDGTNGAIRLPAGFIVILIVYLAAIAALVVHTIFFHGWDLVTYSRMNLKQRQNDVHCRIMAYYSEIPEWLYGLFFIIAFVGSCLVCHFSNLIPWYYLFLAVLLAAFFLLSVGTLRALSGVFFVMEDFFVLIGALLFQGQELPQRSITFYLYTWAVLNRALALLRSLKFAHYMKISPRIIFAVQLVATGVSCIICQTITWYLTQKHPNMCNDSNWQCINTLIYDYAYLDLRSMFGTQSVYSQMYWVILPVGASPALVYLARRKWPHIRIFRSIHVPLAVCTLIYSMCDSSFDIYLTWLIIGLIFHTIIRRWWFDRYAFLCSIGADIGSQVSWFLIFFIFTYRKVNFPSWWGTTASSCPLALANANGTFPQ